MIKNCRSCIHAVWSRDKSGKIMPNSSAECVAPIPPLPASVAWRVKDGYGSTDRRGVYMSEKDAVMNCETWKGKE